MKKLFSTILAVLMTLSCFAFTSYAKDFEVSATSGMALAIDDVSANAGEEVTVNVFVKFADGSSGVAGHQFVIKYPAEKLEIVSASFLANVGTPDVNTAEAGIIRGAAMSGTALTTSGDYFTMKFNVKEGAFGKAAIEFETSEDAAAFFDEMFNPVTVDFINGAVNIAMPKSDVKFDANLEGAVAPNTMEDVEYGTVITLKGCENEDFTFLGWKANGEGEVLTVGTEYTVVSDVTFVGVWGGAKKVYIDQTNGNDGNNGLTAGTAVQTIKGAQAILTTNAGIDTVVFIGEFWVNDPTATNNFIGHSSKTTTITGYDENAKLYIDGVKGADTREEYIGFQGDVIFENIAIGGDEGNGRIAARGHKVVFGEGVTYIDAATKGETSNVSVAVKAIESGKAAEVVINNGNVSRLMTNDIDSGEIAGKVDITVDGDDTHVGSIIPGIGYNNIKFGQYGILNVTVNGGTVDSIKLTPSDAAAIANYDGLRYYTINGGGHIDQIEWVGAGARGANAATTQSGITVVEVNDGTVTNIYTTSAYTVGLDDSERVAIFNNGTYKDSIVSASNGNRDSAIVMDVRNGALKAVTTEEFPLTADAATVKEWSANVALKGFSYTLADDANFNAVKVGDDIRFLDKLEDDLIPVPTEAGLYEVEFINAYNVTINGKTKIVKAGDTITLEKLPQNGALKHIGWATTEDATEATIDPATDYVPTADVTLYPVWSAFTTYTITFETAQGTAPEAISVIDEDGDDNGDTAVTELPAITGVPHFTFLGWSYENDNVIDDTDAENLTNPTDIVLTESIILYAVWKEDDKATVTYVDAYVAAPEEVTDYVGEEIEVAAPGEKDGFTFLGWTDGQEVYQAGDKLTIDADGVTLTAKWSVKIAVDANGAKGTAPEISGEIGTAIDLPTEVELTYVNHTFKGFALTADGEVITGKYTVNPEDTLYVIWEEDPKYTITIIDGEDTVDTAENYAGEIYTFKALEHTTDSRFVGYSVDANATEATYFAGDEVEFITDALVYYAVRKEVVLEDAEYTFAGEYDYSEQKYIIEMYYEGPKANMTAFGLAYPAAFEVVYSDELQSTDTNEEIGEGYYVDVVYPVSGGTFGDDIKTPVLVATISAAMTADEYINEMYELFGKYSNNFDITGAYKNGEWQYIKNRENLDDDVASNVYPIYFTKLVDDKAVTVKVENPLPEVTTVTAPTEGTMLTAITFTAVTAENEAPAQVSYFVDGVPMGGLEAVEGVFTIPAEKVLGDVTIEFSYGEPITEVTITDIEAPVAQATPDTEATAPADAKYTIDSVEWEPADDAFGFDTAYTVKVTVTSDADYAFTGKTVYTIGGEKADVERIDSDTVVLSYTFEKTVEELGTVTVSAGLVRAADKAAYQNFGKISIIDADGTVVASAGEGTEAGNVFAAEFSILAGTYTVKIEKNGYLTYTTEIDVVYNGTTTVETALVAGNLREADLSGSDDDVISLLDFAAVTRAFTAETDITDVDALAAYRAKVDIDEDGFVTVDDLLFVKNNFGATAE